MNKIETFQPECKKNLHIGNKLKAILSPWSLVPKDELPELMRDVSVPVIELARRAGVSPQKALHEAPTRVTLNGQDFRVKKDTVPPNLRIIKLIRDSVGEPPIKGVRNGARRLDEKHLKRKIVQTRMEREHLIFEATEPFDKNKENIKRRAEIHKHIVEKSQTKATSQNEDKITINENDDDLKILKSLVRVNTNDIRQIARNAQTDPKVQLFDFVRMLGLPDQLQKELRENHDLLELLAPPQRAESVQTLKDIVDNTPTLHALSKDRIHPLTSFEKGVPLFFGMGGGSRMPCQGLPLDVLKMVLTGEKLRRELGLSKCFVLGADVITYTNIGRSPDFTKEKVDQVIGTEVAILNEVFRRFGFSHWEAIKQTEIPRHFPEENVLKWNNNIKEADAVSFVGGHHYAIEMSDIQLLVPDGVKLGWWIRPLTRDTGYIMDEQPFHARFALIMGFLGKPHATTLLYAHAGSRLLPGNDGLLQKEAPYITYTPERRLLLSPFENIQGKLEWAARRGGGLNLPFVRQQMGATIDLFEQLVTAIPNQGKTEDEIIAHKLQCIVNQGVGGDSHLSQMWKEAFPNAL